MYFKYKIIVIYLTFSKSKIKLEFTLDIIVTWFNI